MFKKFYTSIKGGLAKGGQVLKTVAKNLPGQIQRGLATVKQIGDTAKKVSEKVKAVEGVVNKNSSLIPEQYRDGVKKTFNQGNQYLDKIKATADTIGDVGSQAQTAGLF